MSRPLEHHAEQLAALGHPLRLAILRKVVQGDPAGTPAGELQSMLDVPASTLSHHLKTLAASGLLSRRAEGTFLYYAPELTALRRLTDFLWEDCCKGGARSKECC
jgi:ArsR family transcriptional regulator